MLEFIRNLNPQQINQFLNNPANLLILGIVGFIGVVVGFILSLGIYIYFSLALMTLAKKLGYDRPWLAWIPIANMFLFPILAEKRWYWGFLLFVPFINAVFLSICLWRIFEKRGYDGKWGLIGLFGLTFKNASPIGFLVFLIALGILAWKK